MIYGRGETNKPLTVNEIVDYSFLKALKSVGYKGPLVIEREAGNSRVADVLTAIETLRRAAAT